MEGRDLVECRIANLQYRIQTPKLSSPGSRRLLGTRRLRVREGCEVRGGRECASKYASNVVTESVLDAFGSLVPRRLPPGLHADLKADLKADCQPECDRRLVNER